MGFSAQYYCVDTGFFYEKLESICSDLLLNLTY